MYSYRVPGKPELGKTFILTARERRALKGRERGSAANGLRTVCEITSSYQLKLLVSQSIGSVRVCDFVDLV